MEETDMLSSPHQKEDSSVESILQVTVHFCEKLKSNSFLNRPVVCLHIVDADHGTYVKKSRKNRAVISFYEGQRDDIDYLMPVMSQPCTPQVERWQVLSWEESFIINEKFEYFLEKELNVVLFFEIIDLVPLSSIKQQYERLNESGMRKIGWAFLKLLGANGAVNTGAKLHLQLYKPPSTHKNKKLSKIEVYRWWSKYPRIPLLASLYISVEPYIVSSVEPALRSMLPMQQEIGSSSDDKLENAYLKESSFNQPDASNNICEKDKDSKVTWKRKAGEPCKIPSELSLTLEIINNCQVLKFSCSGRMLAAACGAFGHYYILIYEIPDGKLIQKNVTHSEMIYDLDWSQNNNYVLSASGDYSAKLWYVKPWGLAFSFMHPSFVYSAKFHPSYETLLSTACYDHIIRIWTFNKAAILLKEIEAHHSPVYAICWHEEGKKLISGDNCGEIKVWETSYIGNIHLKSSCDYDYCCLLQEINLLEIKGISINKIISDVQTDILCLFCGDSVVRFVSLSSGEILSCYKPLHTSQNIVKGCCSPCGNLLFLSSDEGRLSVWDKNTCEMISVLSKNMPMGDLSCIEYHPYDHMLAVSSWGECIPIHIYIHDEFGEQDSQQKFNKDDGEHMNNASHIFPGALSKSPEKKVEDVLSEERTKELIKHMDLVTSDFISTNHKIYKQSKCNTEETVVENSKTMSSGSSSFKEKAIDSESSCFEFPNRSKEKCLSESLTAIIAKSGKFDIIAVENSAESESSCARDDYPSALKRSSKRSQRRKRLRDMNKA